MRIFTKIPLEVENTIWEYSGLFKLRNGILIPQTKIPINIIEHFKCLTIKVHFTRTKIIMCALMTKVINKNIHVFKVIIYPYKIAYVYSNTQTNDIDKNYFKNYETYEVY